VNQFHHFTCKEPSLAGLVALRNNGAGHFCKVTDIGCGVEMTAFCKCFVCSLSYPVNSFDAHISKEGLGLLETKVICLKVLVIEAVRHKVDQIRHNRLSAFSLQKLCKVIVCSRKEFHQDLSYNSYTRFLLVTDGNGIKIMNHLTAHFLKLAVA